MRLTYKNLWTLQLVRIELIGTILLVSFTLWRSIFPVIGSIYALAGVRALAITPLDFSDSDAVDVASKNFEQAYAYHWSPSRTDTYLKLAQAFMLRNNPEFAVMTLERAYLPVSKKLFLQSELPQISNALEQAKNAATLNAHWEELVARMVEFGDDSIDSLHYDSALRWYALAIKRDPSLQPILSFRRAIASVFSEDPSAMSLLAIAYQFDKTLDIYPLASSLKISGSNFRWMTSVTQAVTYGTPLSYGTIGDTTGMFWWSGEAIAVVKVEQAGDYWMSVRARHSAPAPVHMAIGIDRHQIKEINLNLGDNSWETITIPINLHTGLHTISLWFMNDGFVNATDRDAAIEWVELQTKL